MAVQAPHKKKPGYQVDRTPAPHIEAKTGGEGYAEANYSGPSSLSMPDLSQGTSRLAQNLRESVDDPVMDQILKSGVAGRGDQIPADGSVQERAVSDVGYRPTHGAVRQQQDLSTIGKPNLPAALDKSGVHDDSGSRRDQAVKRTQ
jgi:hypothetical protein